MDELGTNLNDVAGDTGEHHHCKLFSQHTHPALLDTANRYEQVSV